MRKLLGGLIMRKMKKNKDENTIPYILMTLAMGILGLLAVYIAFAGMFEFIEYIFSGSGNIIEFLIEYFVKYKIPLIISAILGFGLLGAFHHYGFISDETFKDQD